MYVYLYVSVCLSPRASCTRPISNILEIRIYLFFFFFFQFNDSVSLMCVSWIEWIETLTRIFFFSQKKKKTWGESLHANHCENVHSTTVIKVEDRIEHSWSNDRRKRKYSNNNNNNGFKFIFYFCEEKKNQ